jgi:hypothetical protein
MKLPILIAGAAFAVFSVAAVAQQSAAAAGQTTTVSTPGAQAHQSTDAQATAQRGSVQANGSSETSAEMRPVRGELVGKLDSKSAKAGDSVVLKTKEATKTADGMEIPKGSRLVGHVTEVEAHGSGHADSSMSLVFDHAELKNGQQVAIHSVVESVAPPAGAVASSALDSDDSLGAPVGGGGGMRAAGGGRAGGGLLGGTAGSTAAATGGVASNLNSTANGALRTTSGVAGGAAAGVGGLRETAGATGSAAGALTAHATGIPGVMLAGSASGLSSGTLTASKKNVHLDSGTEMVVGVAGAASSR